MAAARGTERAANCLATLFARLTPPTQVFPFPQTASPAANKDSRLLQALARGQKGPYPTSSETPSPPRPRAQASGDTHLPLPSAGQIARDSSRLQGLE